MEIQKQIQEIEDDRKFKILLLGTGNCGKSTLFKQIRQIYSNGYDEKSDKITSVAMNRENCIKGILALIIKADELYNIDRELHKNCYIYQSNKQTKQHIKTLKQYAEQHFDQESLLFLSQKDWNAMRDSLIYLWQLPQLKAVYKKQEYFSIFPNLCYFLDRMDQLFNEDYIATTKDVIESDNRTTGVVNIEVNIDNNTYIFYDTGGQMNERKKWIHQFNNVDCVIFVAALDHYATVLFEDESINAMKESLQCFDEICNGKWFRKSEMILVLTRTDLFKQRLIDGVSLNYCFEDYDGDNFVNDGNMDLEQINTNEQFQECYDCALLYIKNEYKKLNQNKYTTIYIHLCDTNNTDSVERMLCDIQHILMESTLKKGGFV